MQTEISYKNSKGEASSFDYLITKANATHLWGFNLDTDKFKQLRRDRIVSSSEDLEGIEVSLMDDKLNKILSELSEEETTRLKELL